MQRRHFLFLLSGIFLGAYAKAAGFSIELLGRLSQLSNYLSFPGNPKFAELKKIKNPALQLADPTAILQTPSTQEIGQVLLQTQGTQLRVRSGGHSFEGFSMGSGLVVDVRKLKQLRVEADRAIAGAGLTLSELQAGLAAKGFMFPVGSCPSVGLAGYLLGGGFSLQSRLHGLGADRVQSMKVILANGDSVHASPTEHADLYWALLGGGGGNFAVVEEFHLDLIPLKYELAFDFVFPSDRAQEICELWEKQALEAPLNEMVVLLLNISNGKLMDVRLHGVIHETDPNVTPEQILASTQWNQLKNINPKFEELKLRRSDYMRVEGDLVLPFKGTSHFADQEISSQGFLKFQEAIEKNTLGSRATLVLEPLGGRITFPPRENSFPHRQSKYVIEYYTGWNRPGHAELYKQNLCGLHRELDAVFSKRSYINYCDLNLPADWAERYYADSLPRLLEVKKLYDPEHRFDYGPQSLSRYLKQSLS